MNRQYSQEVVDAVYPALEDYADLRGGVAEVIDAVIAIPAVQRLVLEQMGLEGRQIIEIVNQNGHVTEWSLADQYTGDPEDPIDEKYILTIYVPASFATTEPPA